MDTGVSTEFIAALKEEAAKYERDVISGKCKTFEIYKYKSGYIHGLQMAERILHDTIETMLVAQDIDD